MYTLHPSLAGNAKDVSFLQQRREVTQKLNSSLLVASPQYHNGRSQELSSPLKPTPLGPASLLLLHAMAR
jgi:hypothetical protein